MNTKMKMRMLSLLLCFVMLVGLMPTSVFAAGGNEFVHFAIKEHWGVYFEQTGSSQNYPITLTNENKLSVPIPTLYRTDSDDYVFDGWYIADTNTKVTQDTVFDGYTIIVDRWTFQEKAENTLVKNISIENVELEVGMTTAEYNAAVFGANATVHGITSDSAKTYTIYHGLNKSGDPLGVDEEVEVGQDYSVVTTIKLADGYTFDENLVVTASKGTRAGVRYLGGAGIYTKEWNTLANSVEVTINFMNTDYYFEQTPESRNLENYAQYKNWYTVSKLEGLESVTLQYEHDGAWALFIDNVPFEAKGEQAGGYVTVSPYVNTTKTFRLVANYTQGKVYSEPFEISWARLNPVIESIGIGVIAPQNGYSPEYTVTLSTPVCTLKSENASTVKNGIKWTGETGELKVSDGVFVNESDYTVSIKLVAQDGYTFANDVTATINANSANVSVVSDTEIKVSYTFPKYEPPVTKYYVAFSNAGGYASGTMATEWVEAGNYTLPAPGFTPYKGYEFVGWMINGELKQPGDVISISDNIIIDARWKNADAEKIGSLGISITAPKNQNSPEYTAILTTSKCKLKDVSGISWVGENVGELNVNSKFNNDNDYTVTIKLVAEDGYKFTNSVTATVNANNAIVSVKSESEIWVSYTFAKPVKHLVTFNTNSTFATGTMSPVEAVEGSYTLPTPTYTPKDGYTFAGWLLNGYIIQPGNEITLTSPITLEARWKSDYTSVGFTVQPSSPAEKKVAQQILYRTTNFTIDPSIAYDSIIAQVYNEETGEWVDSIYDGDNLIVTAGNGAIDSGFGYDQIVFNAKVPGKYTFRIVAKQSGLVVACSENFTVTWVSNAITAQPKGDMIDIGATLKITVKTNFYIASSEIEYYDKTTGTWKLYESVGGFNWNPFSYNFTNNAETSTKFRVKLYESVGNLTATSNEFTITWTNHKHTYGVSPNGKDETNHWKECTDPACPDKAHSKIEAEAHKDNTADYKCDVCGYDMPVPTYTVSFVANGGTGSMADATGVSGDYVLPVCGFTAPNGKQFKAWSVGGVEKAAGAIITVNANTTVTAVWEAVEYNVTVTGGTASVGAGTPITKATMGTTVTLIAGQAPAGQEFDKWVVNGVVVADANSATTTFVMPAGEVTATATYKDIPVVTYTVTFNANGGTGSMADATGVSGEYVLPVCGFTAPNGKQFKAWSVGGVEKAAGAIITVNANTTVTAVWENIPVTYYTVTFDSAGGTAVTAQNIEAGQKATKPADPTKSGYDFKGWTLNGSAYDFNTAVNGDITLVATWEQQQVVPTTYTVSFDSNGGSAVTAQNIEAGQKATKPADPTKSGYDFKGWTLNGSAYDFNTAVNGDITLVATWEQQQVVPTTYTVSFVANGGTGTMADVTGISGEYTLPANGFTAPDGKQFKAWSVGGAEKAVGDKITVTANTTVTAVWETIPAGHTCDIKPVAKVEPSCTEGGKEAYYKCEGCGKFYEDALGAKEITDLAAWGNIAKNGHTESDWKSDKDNHWKECTVAACGVIIENSKAAHADANNDGKCDTCEYNVGTTTTKPEDTNKPSDDVQSPQTGDNSMMWLWVALLFVSGFGVVATTVIGKKRSSAK